MERIIFLALVTVCSVMYSCTSDKNNKNIVGDWRLESAMRNYQKTSTLDSAYMVFEESGVFRTNLGGFDERHSYTIDKQDVLVSNSDLIKKMKMINLTDSTLHLRLIIKQTPFELKLVKN